MHWVLIYPSVFDFAHVFVGDFGCDFAFEFAWRPNHTPVYDSRSRLGRLPPSRATDFSNFVDLKEFVDYTDCEAGMPLFDTGDVSICETST